MSSVPTLSMGSTLAAPIMTAQSIDWDAMAEESARLLSRYIQFDTTNPPGQEVQAIEYLADLLSSRGFDPIVIEPAPGRANVIVRHRAPKATAPPCLLYAHADVVPADAADWSVPPFGGDIKGGYVWGRGALDDKGLGIIFLQALTLLSQVEPPLQRDVILLIGADEEKCGRYGVPWLLEHHPDLIKAEYVWDEGGMGLRWRTNQYRYQVAVAEKTTLTVRLVAHGQPGHASLPNANNPHERLVRALYRLQRWSRPAQPSGPVIAMLKLLANQQPFPRSILFANADRPIFWRLLRTWLKSSAYFRPLVSNTVSLTMLAGGQATNVLPTRCEACLDIRLLPNVAPDAFMDALRDVINDPDVSLELDEMPVLPVTVSVDTPFFKALTSVLSEIGLPGQVTPYLTPGATDSRFFRAAGMKAYGFVPMLLDDKELSRIHGIDERVSIANLGWGTRVVFETLKKL